MSAVRAAAGAVLAALSWAISVAPAGAVEPCHVLLLGDSTVATRYLPAGARAPDRVREALGRAYPAQAGGGLVVDSLAQDGDFVGNLLASGRYERDVLARHDDLDVVIVRFGGNDWKRMSPAQFRRWLDALVAALAADYPGVALVLETGVYYDPAHMSHDENTRADRYWQTTREVAAARGLVLADVNAAWRAATAAGRWDLRVRADLTVDASRDAAHAGDAKWFDNSHPNAAGVEVSVEALVAALRARFPGGLPTAEGRRVGDGSHSVAPGPRPVPRTTRVFASAGPVRSLDAVPLGAPGQVSLRVEGTLDHPAPAGDAATLVVSGRHPRKVGLPADPTSGPDRVRQWFNAEIEPGGTLTLTPAGPGNFTRLTVDRVDWRAED